MGMGDPRGGRKVALKDFDGLRKMWEMVRTEEQKVRQATAQRDAAERRYKRAVAIAISGTETDLAFSDQPCLHPKIPRHVFDNKDPLSRCVFCSQRKDDFL